MVIFVVGLCIVFIVSSTLYLITKQLLKMKDSRKYPDPDQETIVNDPNPGDGGSGGNDNDPNPGDGNP